MSVKTFPQHKPLFGLRIVRANTPGYRIISNECNPDTEGGIMRTMASTQDPDSAVWIHTGKGTYELARRVGDTVDIPEEEEA